MRAGSGIRQCRLERTYKPPFQGSYMLSESPRAALRLPWTFIKKALRA